MGRPLSLPKLDIPQLLHQYGLHPKKSLGQNFLMDEEALAEVVDSAQLSSQDDVLEIGAGLGSLTRQLAIAAHSVVAVEVDARLIPALKHVVGQFDNVRVVQGDILSLDPGMLFPSSPFLVVANIPYYITSALIRHLLESHNPPRRLVLTLQQEVAERICALPGKLSLLALSVQVYGQPDIVFQIPAGAFYPPPKVDSSVLRVERFSMPLIPASELEEFFHLVKAGFSQKRKTLRNALAGGLQLSALNVEALLVDAGIDPKRRAETLSLSEWHRLTSIYRQGHASV
jgi:16S rRNA (adenine1518-N6/adenine1519-N6)-dimethyltransferase